MNDTPDEGNSQHAQPDGRKADFNQVLDVLWKQSHLTHYDSLFQEIRYEKLLRWLQAADIFTAWIVAVTATGTGIGGWALWGSEDGKYIWAGVAGIATLVSITHAVLKITDRRKQHLKMYRDLRSFRHKMETFRQSIRRSQIVPTQEKVEDAEARYELLRLEYEELFLEVAPLGVFDAREKKIQREVNKRLKDGGWL